ncbi:hypothetical protein [Guptibacillus hwajinpoensis]|uniref:Lipoprotein n=1 Tax=Guptibacillus hwajinpoensis TaxID=208199 RepID=A0A0J6CXY0_9BACL|nr:hypothetical protein [Alkalihalobacillus macyae]KMM37948.1 hypothetical protein AB986_01020 [Alkalihalobacillus macyae]
MKNIYLVIFVLLVAFLSACGSNTWVLEKDRLAEVGSVKSYVEQLQNEHTDFQGFRVLTISEGKKMVVVSTGTSNQTLKFKETDVSNNSTKIIIEEESTETDEKNPYILIGIDQIKGEFSVVNENEEKYKEYD